MVAWPVLCYPVGACWHSHRPLSLALGCSRDFLPILVCFSRFTASIFVTRPSESVFRIRLVLSKIFLGFRLRPSLCRCICVPTLRISSRFLDFPPVSPPAPPLNPEKFFVSEFFETHMVASFRHADSESEVGICLACLVSEIFAFIPRFTMCCALFLHFAQPRAPCFSF